MNNTEMRDLSDSIGPIPQTTPAQRLAAQLAVTGRAHDASDAAFLLAALGLKEEK